MWLGKLQGWQSQEQLPASQRLQGRGHAKGTGFPESGLRPLDFFKAAFRIHTAPSARLSLDIGPMLFGVIKPSACRQLFTAAEVRNPISQNYMQQEEKHVSLGRDEIAEEISSHLPLIPCGWLQRGGMRLKSPANNLGESLIGSVKTLLQRHLGIISTGIHDIC